jgi:type I restriction enzyme R subunit
VEKTLDAIAAGDKRILLTLATGTGKTRIAFHIAWKLFQTRWTIVGEKKRRPRILFLADRNILANQAYNEFSAFTEDERIRISPKSIAKRKSVPTNANIFFTIFQTFMTGPEGKPNFGEYPQDFFDVIIVDECHRGGANDESNWRDILEYFASAVQIGLTATPKRKDNVDTYKYFGDPKFVYKLKDGIEDGFLTPFRVRKYTTNIDEYVYDPEDDVLEGDIEAGEEYTDGDWNTKIEIRQREEYLVDLFMKNIGTNEKTIVFCANQNHAAFHHAPAQGAVKFFNAGGAAVYIGGFYVAQLGELGGFGQGLKLAGVPVFGAAASVQGAFNEGVPSTACGALAQPTGRGAAAVRAGEYRFVFSHAASLTFMR